MGRYNSKGKQETMHVARAPINAAKGKDSSAIGYTKVVTAPKRTAVTTKYKPKVILTENFIKKVDFLHAQVTRGHEWSAILLYKTKEGSVDDANKWVIEVQDLILKDIGSPGYTEYDMTADDPSNDIWMDHLEAGGKIGHLHTHHNMTCFFSGTDTDELHTNAPQHNYYLSLIVNYKDTTNWCAKVAICGDEVVEGTMTTTKSWKGAKGLMTATEEESLSETKEMLYLMECVLEAESTTHVPEGLQERIDYIKVQKAKAIPAYTYQQPVNLFESQGQGSSSHSSYSAGLVSKGDGTFQRHASPASIKPYSAPGRDWRDEDDDEIWRSLFDSKGDPITPVTIKKPVDTIVNKFSPEVCAPILAKILDGNIKSTMTVEECIMTLEQADEVSLDIYMDGCADTFLQIVNLHFAEELTAIHIHAITVSMYAVIEPYSRFNAFDYIDTLLAEHLMMEGDFIPSVIKTMTGIPIEDQVMLEKVEIDKIIEHED